MKIKNLLLAGLALFAMSACSSDDSTATNQLVDGNLKFRVNAPGFQTRVADEAIANGALSDINNMQIILFKGSYSVKNLSLTPEDITKAKGSEGYMINKIDGGIDRVLVFANSTADDNAIKAMSTGKTEKEVLAVLNGADFNRIQPIEGTGIGKGIKNAPLKGVATEFGAPIKDENGVKTYKVDVKIIPAIARVEVLGSVTIDPRRIENFKLSLISLDNFINDNAKGIKFTVNQLTGTELDTKYKTEFPGIFEAELNKNFQDNNYAYHVYEQANAANTTEVDKHQNVKLLLRTEYTGVFYKTDNPSEVLKKEDFVKYHTLRLALGTNKDEVILEPFAVAGGKLYKVNLGKIDWNGDGKVDDDDKYTPETSGSETPNPTDEFKNATIIVEVASWEAVTTIPQN